MPLLTCHGIQKSYRRNHVLRGIDFGIEPGTLTGIVGENGSGKSTLLKILAGELKADRGSVRVAGSIGYCPQDPVVNDSLTISQHIEYFKVAYRLPSVDYAGLLLDELHFRKFENEKTGNLSGGTRQKLNLTLALMHQPSILLLDEPYQGFDWETYLHFWSVVEELKQSGKAVLVISHLVFDREKFDRLLTLENGVLTEVTK